MFLMISIMVLILSFFLFSRVSPSMNLRKINMISWIFYYYLFLQSFVASILVIYNIDHHYLISRVGPQARFYGWFAIQYAMLATPLGMVLGLVTSGKRSNKKIFSDYANIPIQSLYTDKDTYIRVPLYILSMLSVVSIIYVFVSLGTIPLFSIFAGSDSFMLAMLRQSASREFTGNQYIRNIFAITFTPILSYISYCYWIKTKDARDFLWFLIMFLCSIMILTYDLSKAPLIGYFLGFIFLKVISFGVVSSKTIIKYFMMTLTMVILLYVSIMKTTDLKLLFSYNSGIIGRILLSQSAGTFLSFDFFPSKINHIGFASVSGFVNEALGLVGSERSARLIMKEVNPAGITAGVAGVVNSLFVAEAWANYGFMGLVISPIIVGMVVQIIFITLLRIRKSPITVALMAYLPMNLPITGGFNDFFYNPKYMILFLTFTVLYFSGRIFRGVSKNAKKRFFAIWCG